MSWVLTRCWKRLENTENRWIPTEDNAVTIQTRRWANNTHLRTCILNMERCQELNRCCVTHYFMGWLIAGQVPDARRPQEWQIEVGLPRGVETKGARCIMKQPPSPWARAPLSDMAFDLCCDMAQETATNHQLQWLVVTARNAGRHSRVSLSNRLGGFILPGRSHIKEPRHIFGRILTQFSPWDLLWIWAALMYPNILNINIWQWSFQLNREFPVKFSPVQAAPVSQPASVDREV